MSVGKGKICIEFAGWKPNEGDDSFRERVKQALEDKLDEIIDAGPDNTLPGYAPDIDNTLPGGQGGEVDNTLPESQPGVDNTLPEGGPKPPPAKPA